MNGDRSGWGIHHTKSIANSRWLLVFGCSSQLLPEQWSSRIALGAQGSQIVWLILRRALLQLAIAVPIGVAGAFGVGRCLESLVVKAGSNALAVTAVTLLMIIVSFVACVWPAGRVSRLDSVQARRYQ
jgi:ABC-type antimicrobial peptide transport system permease subunit